jgi:hypothetical protein
MALAKAVYPRLAATQPATRPVDLDQAGHILLTEPVYVCSRGDLWITHAQAGATEQVMRNAREETIHFVREPLAYVHWQPADGKWRPLLVMGTEATGYELVAEAGRTRIPDGRGYRWDRAISWGERMIVPADGAIFVFSVADGLTVSRYDCVMAEDPAAAEGRWPQMAFDSRGFLAWIPWDGAGPGSIGAVRYVDGQWIRLGPDDGWPTRLIQLVPLLDGSVLQVQTDEDGTVRPLIGVLDSGTVDERRLGELVDQLSDADAQTRDAAFAQLTRFGPGAWDVLERLKPDQPTEAQIRLDQLLSGRTDPTLGGMRLVDGVVEVAQRLRDGGVVLYAPAGVEVHDSAGKPTVVLHAWTSIRPGEPIRLLDEDLVVDARPGKLRLFAWGSEWLAWDEVSGMRRLMGNHLAPMLRDDERQYGHFVAIARGRWVFRTSEAPDGQTLILDPTVPDPTPRLPVWIMDVGEHAGWDNEGWPAIKSGGAWSLRQTEWVALDAGQFRDQWTAPLAMSRPSSQPAEEAPLLSIDGKRYYGGRRWLRVVGQDGKELTWDLPAEAAGDATPTLIKAGEDRLFLFNTPGRVLRIKPTPQGAEPFELEATFTRGIPAGSDIRRIWLDPAGRIVVAYEGMRLAILFPDARVPREIALLIPAGGLVE